MELFSFLSAEALLFAWEENRDMDVLLLDIEMQGMSGVKLARQLRQMVAESGAHSTDPMSPESVEHLCAKCDRYAEEWTPAAETLWSGADCGECMGT